jgi:hypothetical protein
VAESRRAAASRSLPDGKVMNCILSRDRGQPEIRPA